MPRGMPRRLLLPFAAAAFFLLATPIACSSAGLSKPAPDNVDEPDDSTEDPESDGGSVTVDGIKTTDKVRVFVQPGAKLTELLAAIKGAKTSIHLTIYILTSSEVIDALIAQKKAGIEVQVILNKTFPDGSNQTKTFDRLKKGGIEVVWATASLTFTHSKCLIIDKQEAWIMTMNLTETSPFDNREYLAVVDDPKDVDQAEAVFQGDFTGIPKASNGKLIVAPVNAESSLIQLIDEAKTAVDIEGESFGDYDITKALIRAKKRGLMVRLVTSDGTLSDTEVEEFASLKAAGIPIVRLSKPYVHAKALVADGKKAYVGSANFTYNSLTFNREIGVVIGAKAAVSLVGTTIAQDFTAGRPY